MTTIYLIRHAEAEGNLYRRIQGWYDSLITENGFRQIAALEARFRDIPVDAVYTSGLYRTNTTGRAIFRPKGLTPIEDPDLREIHLGDWEDMPWGGVRHAQRTELERFNNTDPTWRAPNGENFFEVAARVVAALERIARAHPDQTAAVFSHGTAIRQSLAVLKGLKPEDWHTMGHSDNTAVSCLHWDGAQFTVVFEGDNSHLDESISTLARQTWWRKDAKAASDVNLWYRPLNWETEQAFYLEARREAWTTTHLDGPDFRPEDFLPPARERLARTPWGITVVMSGDSPAGLLELDDQRYSEDGAGYIPFCYILPDRRGQHLGVQLIGQAVSFFRPLGRDKLRLRCAPYNARAQHFYAKYGFEKIGTEQGSRVPLDILEKYIGYDR